MKNIIQQGNRNIEARIPHVYFYGLGVGVLGKM